MKRITVMLLSLSFAAALLSGCATVGRNFPEDFATTIVLQKTTRAEIEKALGAPFRIGLDSGAPTASYLYYRFGLFSEPVTKDLTVTYTPQGTVKSYTFNSNEENVHQREQANEQREYNQR